MPRSRWGFTNTQHSEPHDEDSRREAFVQQHYTEAWTSSTVSNTYLALLSIFREMYRHNTAEILKDIHPVTRIQTSKFMHSVIHLNQLIDILKLEQKHQGIKLLHNSYETHTQFIAHHLLVHSRLQVLFLTDEILQRLAPSYLSHTYTPFQKKRGSSPGPEWGKRNEQIKTQANNVQDEYCHIYHFMVSF